MSFVPGVFFAACIFTISWMLPWLFPISLPRSEYCIPAVISTTAMIYHVFAFSFYKTKKQDGISFLLRSIYYLNNSLRFIFLTIIALHITGIVAGVMVMTHYTHALNIWIAIVMPTGVSIASLLLFLFGNPHDPPLTREDL